MDRCQETKRQSRKRLVQWERCTPYGAGSQRNVGCLNLHCWPPNGVASQFEQFAHRLPMPIWKVGRSWQFFLAFLVGFKQWANHNSALVRGTAVLQRATPGRLLGACKLLTNRYRCKSSVGRHSTQQKESHTARTLFLLCPIVH